VFLQFSTLNINSSFNFWNYKKQLCLFFIFCLALPSVVLANQTTNSISSVNSAHHGIELYSEYLLDKNYSAAHIHSNLENFEWKQADELIYTPWISKVWQQITIKNTSNENLPLVFIIDRAFTVPTEIYLISENEKITTNDLYSYSSLHNYEDNYHINFIYPSFYLELPPGKNTILLHYLGTKESPKAILYSSKGYAEWGFLKISFLSFVLGMVILMAIYNLVIFIIEKKIEYAYYLLYLSVTFGLTIELSGIERFVTESTHLHLGPNVLGLAPIFLGLFFNSMFDFKKSQPWVYVQIIITIVVSVLYTLIAILASDEQKFTAYGYYLPVMSYISLLGIYGLTREWLRGSKQALILLGGLFALVFATVITVLSLVIGFVPEYFSYASLLGFPIEMTMFSFALSLRRQEALLSEIKAKAHSYGQLEKVFYPHQLTQMRAGKSLEETMPEGEADAAVIAFDVAASSQIKHPHVKDFLHNVMKRCELEMVANYNPDTMSSDAYRVKEMGDGFLCSIGFPFKTEKFSNPAQGAWELSNRFVKAFHEVEKDFAYHEPLFCGIGIAIDKIEAYFPSSGTRQYDLYGRSIVLATRYESYRKMLFEQIQEQGSVIIAQEAVYKLLADEEKQQLREFDLTNSTYKIRDDNSADKLYYKDFN